MEDRVVGQESTKTVPRSLVVGCGGIGGVLSCSLLEAGYPVSICTTNPEVRRRWALTGPYLSGRPVVGPLPTRCILTSPDDTRERFDFVFVAVQPPQIPDVAGPIRACLGDEGRVVCLSNGLCERMLSEVIDEERIIGAVVAWGARMTAPGHYKRTSRGGFLVGTQSGRADDRIEDLVPLLETVGPVRHTLNLAGARMSKLVINCAISSLGTIGGDTLGSLLVRSDVRRLGLDLMQEVAAVARSEGVELERVANLDLHRIVRGTPSGAQRRLAQHALLLAVGARYRHLRSSMLAAIERGREPAVDYINGAVSELGRRNHVPTPLNDAAIDVIWKIYRGELLPGDDALRAFSARAKSAA